MNNFLILNKYETIEYDFPDKFDIKIFYLNENLCEIYCKRLDSSSGWGLNLEIKIYDIENENYFEIINIGYSEENIKNSDFSTSNIKLKLNKNINFSIPKIIYPRNDILISNKYEIINFDKFFSNESCSNNFIDFHIVCYYINDYKLKLIIRRLDEECGWHNKIKLLLYDNNNLSVKKLNKYTYKLT